MLHTTLRNGGAETQYVPVGCIYCSFLHILSGEKKKKRVRLDSAFSALHLPQIGLLHLRIQHSFAQRTRMPLGNSGGQLGVGHGRVIIIASLPPPSLAPPPPPKFTYRRVYIGDNLKSLEKPTASALNVYCS